MLFWGGAGGLSKKLGAGGLEVAPTPDLPGAGGLEVALTPDPPGASPQRMGASPLAP